MGSRLKSGEKVAKGIRKLARKEIDAIIEYLEGRRHGYRGDSVHAARKTLKKVRAVLRLVRDRLSKGAYRRENRGLREVGRALAPQRDAEVLIKTLDKLRRTGDGAARKRTLAKLDLVLQGRHRRAFESRDHPKTLRPVLKSAQRQAGRWPLGKLNWADLCDGLGRTYRRGREAFRDADDARTDENLHEWRKRVKDLSYQLRLVQPVCPKAIAGLEKQIKRLGDRLGEDHDLAMLEAAAKSARLEPSEAQSLLRWIGTRRRQLQSAAFDLGRLLYKDKPARFAARIKRFWKPDRHD
jgi:CHAD domain-containing protein